MKNLIIIILLIISQASFAQSNLESDTLIATDAIIINGVVYTALPTATIVTNPGGQVYLENIEGADFGMKLQAAIESLPADGGIINCRGFIGAQEMDTTVIINKSVRILLGQMVLTMDNAGNENMFNIQSSGVEIIGLGRSVGRSDRSGKTQLVMANSAGDVLHGYHIYNRGFSSITIKDLDLEGLRSDLDEQYGGAHPLTGVGGIYMEKASPGVTGSGNNISSILIDGVYVENTKAHGIYLDTPMLSSINNVRISGAGGHGIFISGGTSCSLNSVYVSSADYAGFVFYQHTYASVFNAAAENCGIGFWVRSSNNMSFVNPGVEETKNQGLPWGETEPYGLNLSTLKSDGSVLPIKDASSSVRDEFVGHGYFISGGESISLIGPYCTNPGDAAKDVDDQSTLTRFLKVGSGNENSSVSLLKTKISSSNSLINQYDVEIEDDVKKLTLEWDPEEDGTVSPSESGVYITSNAIKDAPLYLDSEAENVLVKSGAKLFTPYVNQ